MRTLQGIQYVTDEKGNKTAVLIDLKKHRDLWEDFCDLAEVKNRVEEPREPFEKVKRRLNRQNAKKRS
jgi:hypothetical protein